MVENNRVGKPEHPLGGVLLNIETALLGIDRQLAVIAVILRALATDKLGRDPLAGTVYDEAVEGDEEV